MPSSKRLTGHPQVDWSGIVERLFRAGTKEEWEKARKAMWLGVEEYVVYRAKLRIGPLNDDEDARRDIAVAVMEKLERNDYAHLVAWLERPRRRDLATSCWILVKTITRSMAIDFARGSWRNVAPRGEKFRWVREEPVSLETLEEAADGTLEPPLRDLRHLERSELEALLRALRDGPYRNDPRDPHDGEDVPEVTPPPEREPIESDGTNDSEDRADDQDVGLQVPLKPTKRDP